jgi:L-aspartate oxidase
VLTERVAAAGNIEIFTHRVAVDLVVRGGRCQGAYILDERNERVELFQARTVVLATGGASKAYLYTSNPDGASGDGIAMAWRAGCRVANMEFNQIFSDNRGHTR